MADRDRELAEKIWVTKGARFNAYRRLNEKHHSSLLATALMSVYVVFIQLGPALLPTQALRVDSGVLTFLTAFLAIAILVLSLVEQGLSYQIRAERLHQCGMELNKLYDELENHRGQPTPCRPFSKESPSVTTRSFRQCPKTMIPSTMKCFVPNTWRNSRLDGRVCCTFG